MSIRNSERQIRPSVVLTLAIGLIVFGSNVLAQSDTNQGSGTRPSGDDPFALPEDDPFQLPGVPPLPDQTPSAGPQQRAFQKMVVNEKYAGWRQANDGSDGNRLLDSIRSHWVMAEENGRVTGVVYGIDGADLGNLNITLLDNGREVTTVSPKEDGTFLFPNVRQGVYALVGWGDNAFFAFSFNILRYNDAADENVPTELKITATPNETTINTDWIQFFAKQVKFPVYGRYETTEEETDPPRLYGVEGQSLFLPEARPATSISSHQVTKTSDGRVIGRVHQMSSRNGRPVDLRNTRIILLKGDDVFAAATTDSYGVFEFPDIPSGEYSCVAAGHDGLGCIGIYLGDEATDDEEFAPISFTMLTSETTGWIHNLAIETAYQRVISRPIANYDQNTNNYCPSCGLSGCNGCGGGGGPGRLRPGGYRPPPRSAIPKDQRFLKRANKFVDGLFTRDAEIPQGGYGGGQGYGGGPGNFGYGNPNQGYQDTGFQSQGSGSR